MNDVPLSLLEYVSLQFGAGASPEAIRGALTAHNWSPEAIDHALSMVHAGILAQTAAISQGGPVANDAAHATLHAAHINPQLLRSMQEPLLAWIFRVGFASIFLINCVNAWVRPADFQGLLNSFPLPLIRDHTSLFIKFAGLNDLILGSLILSGKFKRYIWAWAGVWLAIVSLVKLVHIL
jgi:hypothetical protein